MTEEKNGKLKDFLKSYADELREEMDWSEVTPVTARVPMAYGRVVVMDKNDEHMATFCSKQKEYSPSCPITQQDLQSAKLFVRVVNFLGE